MTALELIFAFLAVGILAQKMWSHAQRQAGLREAHAKASALRITRDGPDPTVVTLSLPADGREVFTPLLLPSRVYCVTASGRFHYFGNVTNTRRGMVEADALYRTDEYQNFTQ